MSGAHFELVSIYLSAWICSKITHNYIGDYSTMAHSMQYREKQTPSTTQVLENDSRILYTDQLSSINLLPCAAS